jgi:hypothetical protein
MAVEECRFRVDVNNAETEKGGNSEKASYGIDTNDWGEGFFEIESRNLRVSFGDETSFVRVPHRLLGRIV